MGWAAGWWWWEVHEGRGHVPGCNCLLIAAEEGLSVLSAKRVVSAVWCGERRDELVLLTVWCVGSGEG